MAVATADTLELTERELAIAAGDDPDKVEIPAATPEGSQSAPEGAAATPVVAEQGSHEGELAFAAGNKEVPSATPVPAANQPANRDWLNQEARDYAASYGLSEDELKDFGSLAELRRAGQIFDKQITKQKPTPAVPAVGSVTPAPAPAAVVPATPTPAEVKKFVPYDIEALKTVGYDDLTVQMAQAQNDTFAQLQQANERAERAEKAATQVQQYAQQEQAKQQATAFHQAVDSLDEKRFGRSMDQAGRSLPPNPTMDGNRKKLYDAALLINSGIAAQAQQRGETPQYPSLPVLLKRAEALAFADDIRTEERQKVTAAVTAQSNRRRPVGSHKRTQPGPAAGTEKGKPATPDDIVANILADPKHKQFFAEAQQANGSAD